MGTSWSDTPAIRYVQPGARFNFIKSSLKALLLKMFTVKNCH